MTNYIKLVMERNLGIMSGIVIAKVSKKKQRCDGK